VALIKISKVDRRMLGHGFFTHRAEILGNDKKQLFDRCRQELWKNFGAGREVGWWQDADQLWSWDVRDSGSEWRNSVKFYLREQAATWFILNKERFENEDI
jgi:hypothetical protein